MANVSLFINAVDKTGPTIAGITQRLGNIASKGMGNLFAMPGGAASAFTGIAGAAAIASQATASLTAGAMNLVLQAPDLAGFLSFFTQIGARILGASLQLQTLRGQVTQLITGTIMQLPLLLGQLPLMIGQMLGQVRMQSSSLSLSDTRPAPLPQQRQQSHPSIIINLTYAPVINVAPLEDGSDFGELLRSHSLEVMDVLGSISELRERLSYD